MGPGWLEGAAGRQKEGSKGMAVGSRTLCRSRIVGRMAALVAVVAWGSGCASKASAPAPPKPPAPEVSKHAAANEAAERMGQDLERARADNARLREQLKAAQREAAIAQEQREALRRDMQRALEEVLASKASGGVQNRALAISRIAEVRVQMQSMSAHQEPEVAARLRLAKDLLARADKTLEEGNYGGASYLADQAGEVVQYARTVVAVAGQQTEETKGLVAIVPPRTIEVAVAANLREGPNPGRRRVAGAQPGAQLVAVARLGEWFEVKTETGTAWIHRATLRDLSP